MAQELGSWINSQGRGLATVPDFPARAIRWSQMHLIQHCTTSQQICIKSRKSVDLLFACYSHTASGSNLWICARVWTWNKTTGFTSTTFTNSLLLNTSLGHANPKALEHFIQNKKSNLTQIFHYVIPHMYHTLQMACLCTLYVHKVACLFATRGSITFNYR